MHLTLLSRSSAIYTTRRLADAARLAGHRARVINPLRCEIVLDGGSASLLHRRMPLGRTDVCVPRIGASMQAYGLAVLDHFAQQGIPSLNTAPAIALSRNKIGCLQRLSAAGVPIPATVLARDAGSIRELVARAGGAPVLVKPQHGGERVGVMVCETLQTMEAALEALLRLGHELIVQQYVPEAKGRDLRVLVVGGRVVAVARRVLRVGRLLRNLGAAARFEPARLPSGFAALAERTAALVGLEVAAIDMLALKDGPRVFEVHSCPGIKELEEATGVDAAGAIVARALELGRARRKREK